MTRLGLDHINIVTTKLEQTRAFYCDVIGLVEGYRPAFRVTGYWLYSDNRPIIHLQLGGQDDEGGPGAVGHFALAVSSLGEMTARLDAARISYRLTQTPDGLFEQAFVRDPSGALLEFIARRAEHRAGLPPFQVDAKGLVVL